MLHRKALSMPPASSAVPFVSWEPAVAGAAAWPGSELPRKKRQVAIGGKNAAQVSSLSTRDAQSLEDGGDLGHVTAFLDAAQVMIRDHRE